MQCACCKEMINYPASGDSCVKPSEVIKGALLSGELDTHEVHEQGGENGLCDDSDDKESDKVRLRLCILTRPVRSGLIFMSRTFPTRK